MMKWFVMYPKNGTVNKNFIPIVKAHDIKTLEKYNPGYTAIINKDGYIKRKDAVTALNNFKDAILTDELVNYTEVI